MKKKSIIISCIAVILISVLIISAFGGRKGVDTDTTSTTVTTESTLPIEEGSANIEEASTKEVETLVTENVEEDTTKKTQTPNKKPTSTKPTPKPETTTQKQPINNEPDFEYISTVTGYDGRVYYKCYDETNDKYYYRDNIEPLIRYAEDYVLKQIRPSKEEIYANPISKVTLYGVTWYKFYNGANQAMYLTSNGTYHYGIDIEGLQTNGEDIVTVDGVKFYKKCIDGEYGYYDSNGNKLLYDASYCIYCGESSKVCGPAMNSYYCVVCNETIPTHTCHSKTHYDASH